MASAQSRLAIYPVKGVYGLSRTACDGAAARNADGYTAQVAVPLCDTVKANRDRWSALFHDRMTVSFPGIVDDFAATGGDAGERLARTVVATLHLSRADLWIVPKTDGVSEATMPVTLTLNLTNAASGEVLFAHTVSVLGQGVFRSDRVESSVRAQLPTEIDKAITQLVDEAKGLFRPRDIAGTIVGKAGNDWVLDAGRKAGLRAGDQIGGDADVIFADADYAIIRPVLGDLRTGQSLSRPVAMPIEALERPSVLVVMTDPDRVGLALPYLADIVEHELGGGTLSPMPVNPDFASLRSEIIGKAYASTALDGSRALPDYFLRVSVAAMEPTDMPSNLPGVHIQTFEARAFIDVIDRAGTVIWAGQATDRIADSVSGTISFSTEQRRQTVLRNALVKAVEQIRTGFKPIDRRLRIEGKDEAVRVADPNATLAPGAQGVVLRPVGKVGNLANVMRLVGQYEVAGIEPGTASLRGDGLSERPRAGDSFAIAGGDRSGAAGAALSLCHTRYEADASDALDPTLYRRIAENGFARGFRGTVRAAGFPDQLAALMGQFKNRETLGALQPATSGLCFEPRYKVTELPAKRVGGGDAPRLQVAMGYSLMQGETRLKSGGLQVEMTATPLAPGTDRRVANAVLQRDLAAQAADLTARVAATFQLVQ